MVSVILTARPSFAKLSPLIDALLAQGMDVDLVACASSLLPRYGEVARQAHDRFPSVPLTRLYSTIEGANGVTSAKDTGVLLMGLADHLARIRPDLVVVLADRYETLAASMAAACQNIPIVHLQGGESSGNIDDKVRDANTALATYHFPATEAAWQRVRQVSKQPSAHIWNEGCPSIDVAKQAEGDPPVTLAELGGAGPPVGLTTSFVTILQHAETEYPDEAFRQMWETLEGLRLTGLPAVVFWPGQDAGMEGASKAIRVFADRRLSYPLHTVRTLPPRRFLRLLTQTACLVGNSSAGIREAGYLRVPVVNIGERQRGRTCAPEVRHVPAQQASITQAILAQIAGPRPPRSLLYGQGQTAPRIAERISAWIR